MQFFLEIVQRLEIWWRTVVVGVSAIGKRVDGHWVLIAACCLHVCDRVRGDLTVGRQEVDSRSLWLPAGYNDIVINCECR